MSVAPGAAVWSTKHSSEGTSACISTAIAAAACGTPAARRASTARRV